MQDGPANASAENSALIRLAGLALVVLGVCSLFFWYLAQPPTLRQLGTLARIKIIADFYHQDCKTLDPSRTVIVLGDSMALAGFDANVFDRAAQAQGLQAFDLGMSGISQVELLFHLSEPALAGRHVVLFISPGLFDSHALKIQQRKLDCYRVLGFTLEKGIVQECQQWIPSSTLQEACQSQWRFVWRTNWRLLESWRWTIREHSLRPTEQRLAGNWLGAYATDLKHATWDNELSAKYSAKTLLNLRRYESHLFGGDLQATAPQRECLRFIIERLQATSASVTIVISPLQPEFRAALNPSLSQQYAAIQDRITGPKPRVLDLSGLLPEEDFRDLMHVSNEAAGSVAQAIYDGAFAQVEQGR
jgi:hypothetical protein